MISRPIMIGSAAVVLIAIAIGIWSAFGRGDGSASTGADATNTQLVALGSKAYAKFCASCHGANLEGEKDWRTRKADGSLRAPPHDASGHTWHHPDKALFDLTKYGGAKFAPPGFKSNMPAFGGTLSDREIWAVLAYIKSRWPKRIQERHTAMSKRVRR